MKAIKYISLFFLSMLTFIACDDDEEVSYVLQEISAPTELDAVFDISQDDTGTVSVTPTAVGASIFEVYFGDTEDETPTEAAPGETVTHVYGEGVYNLRIVARGATGLTSELVRVVTISFSAPEDLEVEIIQTNPLEITVTPSATNATVYDVYFGEDEQEEPITILDGESAVYTYEAAGEFTIRVVARGAGAATTEVSETIVVEDLTEAEGFPIDFESNETLSGVFEGGAVSGKPIANPDQSGINTSETVYEFVKGEGAPWYSGIFHVFPEDMDLSVDQVFKVNIWSPKAGINVRFQIEKEGGEGTPPNLSLDQTVEVAEQWVTLTYDFRGIVDPANGYDKFVIFPDFDPENTPEGDGSIYYIDDIILDLPGEFELPQLPIDFEGTNVDYTWNGFGAADFGPIPAGVIANPDASGINTSANVTSITKVAGAQVWAGASLNLAGPIDFSAATTIKVKVWSPRAGTPVLLKIEDSTSPPDGNGNPTVFAEVQASTTAANTWEELSFDLSTFDGFNSANSYDRVILFPDFGNGGQGDDFYFDDITIAQSAPQLPQLPVDFEGSNLDYTWNGFGAVDFGPIPAGVIANPDASGINTSANVTSITKAGGAQVWAGASLNLAGPIDFSSGTTINVKVWSPRAGTPVLLKIEDSSSPPDGNGNPTVFAEVQASTTAANTWEELSFDLTTFNGFNTANSYDRVILFPDFGNGGQGEDFYFDDIMIGQAVPVLPQLPVDFEGANVDYTWNGFGAADFGPIPAGVISNPDASGINTSDNVTVITKAGGAQVWAGASLNLAGPIDFSAGTTIKVKVWSPRAGTPILLKIEDSTSPPDGNGNPTVFAEVQASTTTANTWEELSFDLTTFNGFNSSNSYDRVILFPDFGTGGQGEDFYFDDITQ